MSSYGLICFELTKVRFSCGEKLIQINLKYEKNEFLRVLGV